MQCYWELIFVYSVSREVVVDAARFRAPEGLIKTELLGVDSSTLPQLIREAIAACPMDVRREMWRSVYLSGGTTLTEGFAERLHTELSSLAPPGIEVQVIKLSVCVSLCLFVGQFTALLPKKFSHSKMTNSVRKVELSSPHVDSPLSYYFDLLNSKASVFNIASTTWIPC